jgi:DNA-binding CsgD family transcriptional regulator
MWLKKSDFQTWGAQGGRIRARRLTAARRRQIARIAGSAPKRGRPKTQALDSRLKQMAQLYRSGETLEQIGNKFALTRERVRQILLKGNRHGRLTGGNSVKSALLQKEYSDRRISERERIAKLQYGCSYEQLKAIQGNFAPTKYGTPCAVYRQKKQDAKNRNIEWQFTLLSWWAVWQASGKWEQRGRGAKRYCMARNGDSGPYSPDNVRIITGAENSAESFTKHPHRYPTMENNLTSRQAEAYALYESGLGPKAIGGKMGITKHGAAIHINHAKHKLGKL